MFFLGISPSKYIRTYKISIHEKDHVSTSIAKVVCLNALVLTQISVKTLHGP